MENLLKYRELIKKYLEIQETNGDVDPILDELDDLWYHKLTLKEINIIRNETNPKENTPN